MAFHTLIFFISSEWRDKGVTVATWEENNKRVTQYLSSIEAGLLSTNFYKLLTCKLRLILCK